MIKLGLFSNYLTKINMKSIVKYKSEDDKEFTSKEECERYEKILVEVNKFLKTLYTDDSIDFTNGGGYIKHPKGTLKKGEELLIKLSNEWFKTQGSDLVFINVSYSLCRYIDDSNMKCLNNLRCRLQCMKDDIEYGQPYFALNPDKCEQKQLN